MSPLPRDEKTKKQTNHEAMEIMVCPKRPVVLISDHRGKAQGSRGGCGDGAVGRRKKNQAHCPAEIKVPEKTALSIHGDKSSSSRHSGLEFNSPQPLLKRSLSPAQ